MKPKLTNEAVDVIKNKDGNYDLVVIKYDPEKGLANVEKIEYFADSLAMANYKIQKYFSYKLIGIKE